MNTNFKHFICCFLMLLGMGYSSVASAQENQSVDVNVDGINYRLDKEFDYNTYEYVNRATVLKSELLDYVGDIIIPDTILYQNNKYPVTNISGGAFFDCKEITSIQLPKTLKNIEDGEYNGSRHLGAFAQCTSIRSIHIPNNVEKLGSYAFMNCSALKEITLPDGIIDLGENVFYNCLSLENIKLPKRLKYIRENCFQNCHSLKSISLSDSILFIGEYEHSGVFQGCYQLKSVYIDNLSAFCKIDYSNIYSNPLYSGDADLFLNGKKVTNLIFPNDIQTVKNYAFSGCSSLTSVKIDNNVKLIGKKAFSECRNVTKVYLPKSIQRINEDAFSVNGSKLETFIEDLSSFCNITFDGSSSNPLAQGSDLYLNNVLVKDLVIPSSLNSIKRGIFNGCTSLVTVTFPKNIQTISDYSFSDCPNLKVVNLPDGLQEIKSGAFASCAIDSIHIPSSVTSIGNRAFGGNGLKSVHVDDLSAFLNITLQDTTSSPLYGSASLYVDTAKIEKLVVPQDITDLKPYTFAHTKAFKSIYLHKGIKSIGEDCFSCGVLCHEQHDWNRTYIISHPYITDVEIEDLASFCNITFADSTSNPLCHHAKLSCDGKVLKELNIPQTVTDIKPYSFWGINNISKIVLHENVKSIGYSAFGGNTASVILNSITPPVVENTITDNIMIVPIAALNTYLAADKWKDWSERIYPDDAAYSIACVKAENTLSGIHKVLGEEKLPNVYSLKVIGTINSYDVMLIRNKMLRLKELDLSEASFVENNYPYYEQYCTKNNEISPYTFYNLNIERFILPKNIFKIDDYAFGNTRMHEIVIPEGVKYIGDRAFYSSELRKISLPSSLRIIDSYAFANCHIDSIMFPDKLLRIGSGAFEYSGLQKVKFGKELETIDDYAFQSCHSLKAIKLPSSLKRISSYAFQGCNGLEEIRIPSSLKYVGEQAFAECSNIKKVYTYTIEPTDIQQQTFSCWQTATLYVPKTSYYTYYYNTQWSQFTKLVEFDEPYDNFYLNGDYTLDNETGRVQGVPDVEMNENSGMIVDGSEVQATDSLELKHDGVNGGSIIADNNLHANKLNVNIRVSGGRWYFFCFPFDIPAANIKCKNTKDFVFRHYDGKIRAEQGFGGWKDFTGDTFISGKGYIFQCSQEDTLNISLKDVKFDKVDKIKDLEEFIAKNLQDASWNFTGNPFLSYYDIKDMDYNAPITVWNGSNYVAYNPKDDDYQLAPFEAFFVQKPASNPALNFAGMNMQTYHQSQKTMQAAKAKRALMKTNPSRLLTNIVISSAKDKDQTRLVFNDASKDSYEMETDAAKFISNNCSAQIYTIDADRAHYAINERPNTENGIALGYSAKHAGSFTISASRMDVPMYLRDELMGVTFDLRLGKYSFKSDAGTFNDRFTLLKNSEPTSIEDLLDKTGVELVVQNGQLSIENSNNANIVVYNMAGQVVASQQGDGNIALNLGVYIVKIGGLTVKVSMK